MDPVRIGSGFFGRSGSGLRKRSLIWIRTKGPGSETRVENVILTSLFDISAIISVTRVEHTPMICRWLRSWHCSIVGQAFSGNKTKHTQPPLTHALSQQGQKRGKGGGVAKLSRGYPITQIFNSMLRVVHAWPPHTSLICILPHTHTHPSILLGSPHASAVSANIIWPRHSGTVVF